MIIRKFVGKTESEAAAAAQKELGDGYVIMNVRSVKPKGAFSVFRKKQVELTAAKEDDEEPIRQIRKIAQAQVEASKKSLPPLTGAGIVAAPKEKESAASSAGENAAPAASISAAESSALEKKLDNLQTLLENQLNREGSVISSSRENADKAGSAVSEEGSEPKDKKEEIIEQEKEVDRFLRLLYNTMVENEVDEKYAGEIIGDAEVLKKPGLSMDFLLGNIYQKMILKFGKSDGILPASKGPRVVFFIGPTGVGKTTTIAKIASSVSLTEKKKIALLTTDTYRIAATDQLRTYAGILGVPFRVIYEPDELSKAFEDFADCDYIFVDSAGHSHRNEELLQKQKEFIESSKEMETQIFLVLSATTKYKDLKKIADNYREISDYQLVFTKLDETGEYGNLYNMKCESGATIAYITCGQNVPDDIESFNPQKIVKQLLGGKH
ncbi:MAG: flagellar biosynthesis protein FlhF [Lachnospiraceae bacterium]|nr:flagellar biosynthesis protein FlhF [Lachnospiraceae bacterium]